MYCNRPANFSKCFFFSLPGEVFLGKKVFLKNLPGASNINKKRSFYEKFAGRQQ
jgi:hypothetical protein